jgi:hypothetical protein
VFEKEEDPGNLNYNIHDQDNGSDNTGYSDYGYGYPPPQYDYSYADPYTEYSDQDPYQGYAATDQKYPHSIPDNIKFYEPDTSIPDVPYVTYTEEHSPWQIINSGQSTDHLYRAFKS